jgi:hypothetical protein
MSDIVEQLRMLQTGAAWVCGETAATLEDAADEIERLRKDNTDILAAVTEGWDQARKRQDQIRILKAERDRLREALWQLLTVTPVFPTAAKQIVGMEDRYNAAITNARAALKETGHD